MAVTNLIDSVQQKYAGLTSWSGKPADLWFGSAWPSRSGSFIGYPLIRFTHDGTEDDSDFEYTQLEVWPFTFEVFAETAQTCILIHDRVKLNGQPPESGAGFRYAQTMDMPSGYRFMEFRPVGAWTIDVRDGQFSPSGSMIHVLTFRMELHVHRTAFQ